MGMSFNVYSIGWYIERDAVRNDPAFHPYKSMTHAELTSSEPFYQLMTEEKGYDRTLFAKMAMTIKKDLMIQGLLEELMIPPEHGVRSLTISVILSEWS